MAVAARATLDLETEFAAAAASCSGRASGQRHVLDLATRRRSDEASEGGVRRPGAIRPEDDGDAPLAFEAARDTLRDVIIDDDRRLPRERTRSRRGFLVSGARTTFSPVTGVAQPGGSLDSAPGGSGGRLAVPVDVALRARMSRSRLRACRIAKSDDPKSRGAARPGAAGAGTGDFREKRGLGSRTADGYDE